MTTDKKEIKTLVSPKGQEAVASLLYNFYQLPPTSQHRITGIAEGMRMEREVQHQNSHSTI